MTTPPYLGIFSRVLDGGAGDAPETWREWLADLFPNYVRHPFASRHEEFWEYVWAIEPESHPDPFIGIWPRGGGKSTSVELGVTSLALRRKRRYAIYVRSTQDQADKSVANIATMLTSDGVLAYYPEEAGRGLTRYGAVRGWRRNRLVTAGGFVIDAYGLDTAARGAKMDDQRPDLIILDDIDKKGESPQVVEEKIENITTSLLPARADNAAVVGIQNLIHREGFFSRMVDGRADYLHTRQMSGPHPAIKGLKTEWRTIDPEREGDRTAPRRAMIVAGEPTWKGQDLEECQRSIDTIGLRSFQKECQHDVLTRPESLALRFDEGRHLVDLTDDECRELVSMGRVFGGLDFGSWRFPFTLWAVDRSAVVYGIHEYFSQRGQEEGTGLSVRARTMHEICEHYGCFKGDESGAFRPLIVWGDTANPTDITEMNQHWVNGWMVSGKCVTSPLRCVAVKLANKARQTSVERINDNLDRNTLKFRRSLGMGSEWYLGLASGRDGARMENESRLLWEIDHWSYTAPKEGEAQKQDPNDHTADGADAIASMRYALMSHWSAAPAAPPPPPRDSEDRAPPTEWQRKRHPTHGERTTVSVQELAEKRFRPQEAPSHPRRTRGINIPRYRGPGSQ